MIEDYFFLCNVDPCPLEKEINESADLYFRVNSLFF